jgi:uncharacterized phage protein (TIGR01671 family)
MNRVIKFRAWDGEKMLDLSTLPMDAYQVCFFHDCMLKGKKTFKNAGKSVEVTVMQFTGLTDKNGKEIYEGDILRISDNLVEEVRWVDESNWHGDCEVTGFVNHKAIYHKGPEVIGNVYENPDLIRP